MEQTPRYSRQHEAHPAITAWRNRKPAARSQIKSSPPEPRRSPLNSARLRLQVSNILCTARFSNRLSTNHGSLTPQFLTTSSRYPRTTELAGQIPRRWSSRHHGLSERFSLPLLRKFTRRSCLAGPPPQLITHHANHERKFKIEQYNKSRAVPHGPRGGCLHRRRNTNH